MGHLVGKDIYGKLGEKIDNLTVKAPWNDALYKILKELYAGEEAELVVKMPYNLSNLQRLSKITGYEPTRVKGMLDKLTHKGLIIDLANNGEYYYMPSPMVIGVFEFTMMRTQGNLNSKVWAELFHAYMSESADFHRANAGDGQRVSIARAVPHRDTVAPEEAVEILPYEKAEAIVASHNKFAIGLCSCRHEKLHLDLKSCDVPLDTCASFGYAADYLIRNGMAQEVSRREMLDNLERSRELGLVFSADNVKRNVTFICSCCSCCCNILHGINNFGYHNTLVTSSFIAGVDKEKCTGCGKCARACPINAIKMEQAAAVEGRTIKSKYYAQVEASICLGCGVCALKCASGALQLKKREQKVIHPETTFERNILQSLERGNLQNFIFDSPEAVTHRVMRGLIGGFLRLSPVKKALMSDQLRSAFLSMMTAGVKLQGGGWMTKI